MQMSGYVDVMLQSCGYSYTESPLHYSNLFVLAIIVVAIS